MDNRTLKRILEIDMVLLPFLLEGGGEGEGEGAGESHPSFLISRIIRSVLSIASWALYAASGRPSGPRGIKPKLSSKADLS